MLKSNCRLRLCGRKCKEANIAVFSFLLLLFACPLPSAGQIPAPESLDGLHVWLDYACFRNWPDSSQTYLEIYYLFSRGELKFTREGETYEARIFLNLTIEDQQGDTVENRMWNRVSRVNSWEDTQADFMILDEAEVLLEPGDYVLKLSVTDLGSEAKGEAKSELKVKAFVEKDLQLSDLELAFQIDPDTTASRFTKAGRKILPNPSGVFSHVMEIVYFYGELYNLASSPQADSDYVLTFSVLDPTGKKVKDFGSQTRRKPGNSAVVLSGINISALAQGNYVLRVEAEDKRPDKRRLRPKTSTF